MSVFYDLEFQVVPDMYHYDKALFLKTVLKKGESFFCDIFNQVFERAYGDTSRNLKPDDFELLDIKIGDKKRIIYVKLPIPNSEDMPNVYCKAYCIPYIMSEDSIKILGLYNIECGVLFDTNCIGVSKDGEHLNFGEVGQNVEEILNKISKLAF